MSACGDTRGWLTENVTTPVSTFLTHAEEVCSEVQQKVEEEVEQPVEEWVSQQQEQCEEEPWWNPLRWFCELVTVLVKVVTWVVITVVKWVAVVVCQVVTVVVSIVVNLVLELVTWLAGFVVCLFSEPLTALASLVDLWTIVLGAAERVVNLVSVLLEDVNGILTDIESLVDTVGHMLGPVGTFLAGLVKWVLNIVRGAVGIVRELLENVKEAVFGILRLDWCRIASGFTGIGLGIVQVVLLVPRLVGGVVGGIRGAFDEDRVEGIVQQALEGAFAGDAGSLAAARKKLRLGHRPFGVPIEVQARRFFVSSRSRTVDLRALHERGFIDLDSAVGIASACRGKGFVNWSRLEIVYAGSGTKVAWSDVRRFLDDGPMAVPEFWVFALPMEVLLRDLRLAQRKAHEIGVSLNWRISTLEVTSPEEAPLEDTETKNEGVMRRVGRVGVGDDMCKPPAIAIFGYTNPQRNGLTCEFRPPDTIEASGVTFRDRLPEWLFRWILIHELGHYFGLDHPGHSGVENIMFTNDPTADLAPVTWNTVADYALLTGESRFTIDDAEVVWKWIVANAKACLT